MVGFTAEVWFTYVVFLYNGIFRSHSRGRLNKTSNISTKLVFTYFRITVNDFVVFNNCNSMCAGAFQFPVGVRIDDFFYHCSADLKSKLKTFQQIFFKEIHVTHLTHVSMLLSFRSVFTFFCGPGFSPLSPLSGTSILILTKENESVGVGVSLVDWRWSSNRLPCLGDSEL